ncbi:MAG: hypothetical protein ACU0A5_07025 [Salipiger marinus]|uniref:hypothetical protein n=1 Tax=Salipiger marinus TaxID=555512 RepID=UPI004059AA45
MTEAEIEGRLLAHRRLLARLVAALDPQARDDLTLWLAERSVLQDGQEDPGVLPDGSAALPLSLADELAEIRHLTEARRRY